jgi:hypothetical protein
MKIIFTHKTNLKSSSDVRRMIGYVYGPRGTKVIGLIVGKQFPGLPTGDVTLDAQSLTAGHPGGRAALCRNIVLSGSFLPTREEALAHLPDVGKTLNAFIDRWLPNSAALGVVHISQGKGRFKGQWRLDAHLLAVNWDKGTNKALQFSLDQMKDMQSVESYLPPGLDIQTGRGTGEQVRPKGPLIYPYSRQIDSLEIGKMSDQQLEEHITTNQLQTRRRKNGTIISITTSNGRKINIGKARALVCHLSGEPSPSGRDQEARPDPASTGGVDHHRSAGVSPGHDRPDGIAHHALHPPRRSKVELEALFSRRSRRILRASFRQSGGGLVALDGSLQPTSQPPPLVKFSPQTAVLKASVDFSRFIEQIETAPIIPL